MQPTEELQEENRVLRERLSRMGSAFLRINDTLDLKTVLQGVLDSARSLTDAKYGLLSVMEDGRRVRNCIPSGLTPNQARRMWRLPAHEDLFEYFAFIDEPLRSRDLHSHIRRRGLPEFHPAMEVSPKLTFLVAPIHHRDERVGTVFLAEKEAGRAFTPEDEETLVMFAAQAALVITNARRYRDERRAAAELKTLIDTTPVGVVVFDARQGEPVSLNREAIRIAEFLQADERSPDQILQTLSVRRVDGSAFSLKDFPVIQALSESEAVRAEEVTLEAPNGRKVTAFINSTPNRSDDGRLESVVVTIQDMAPLLELERLRAEFLAMVSHELRAPLAAIKGSTTTALNDTFPFRHAEVVQFLRIIDEQADNMGVLINDLGDMARIETGTLVVSPAPATVTGLLEQARNTIGSGQDKDNIHIEVAPGLSPIMADPGRIGQVLVNLLTNAAQNSPEDAPIRVTATQHDGHVVFTVFDKGRGVSPDLLPRLFRKFSRPDRDSGFEYDAGYGSGLSICKGIVEAHGGRIWAESEGPGTGTRFKFTIPVAEDAGVSRSVGPTATGADIGLVAEDQTRILVVDDDPQTLRSVRQALSKAGYAPVVTGDPNDALQLVEKHRPELILLDLVLPGSDGIELMQKIVERANVPVIFLSAYGHEDAIVRAFDSGAADYVVKPFSPSELTARIRAILRNWTPPGQVVPSEPLAIGDLEIDYARRRVTMAESPVKLTRIEYRLLRELSVQAGQTVFHEDLLKSVWGRQDADDKRILHAAVKNIRRKLDDSAKNPRYLFNEPRVGYRLGNPE